MIEDVGVAVEPGRAAGDHYGFVEARTALGHGRGLEVEVDVIGDEEIELAIAIVINEGATCTPSGSSARHSGSLAYIGKASVAVVVIENILAVVGDE